MPIRRRTSYRSDDARSAPSTVPTPCAGRISVAISRRAVVLPAPFAPNSPTTSPGPTSRFTSRRICVDPILTPTPSRTTSGAAAASADRRSRLRVGSRRRTWITHVRCTPTPRRARPQSIVLGRVPPAPPCDSPLLPAFGPSHTETAIGATLTLVAVNRNTRVARPQPTVGNRVAIARFAHDCRLSHPSTNRFRSSAKSVTPSTWHWAQVVCAWQEKHVASPNRTTSGWARSQGCSGSPSGW